MQLDAKQQQMLARAAALLPSAQQAAFRESVRGVIGTLLHFPPTDAELRDTCRFILAAHGISVGVADLLPPRQTHNEHDRSANNWRNWARRKSKELQEASGTR